MTPRAHCIIDTRVSQDPKGLALRMLWIRYVPGQGRSSMPRVAVTT